MTTLAIFVVLALPNVTLALIARVIAIVDAMSKNKATFPSPTPALSVVSGHVADLQTAETAAQTHAKGMVQARDAKKKILIADAHQLHAYVQQLCAASPEQAEAIALLAAMSLKKPRTNHKSDIAVQHVVSGTVKVLVKAQKGAHAHDWQLSSDGGKTWTSVPPTLAAHTTITGLTPGSVVSIRHRYVTKSGASDWGQPISSIVS
jgi:hypothetical protein